MHLCYCVLDWHVSAGAMPGVDEPILKMWFTCSSTYFRPDMNLTGFQTSVSRLFLLFCFSLSMARGQQCVWETSWYELFTHACLSVSWGCGICTVESLWTCHVQIQQIESVWIFVVLLHDMFYPPIHWTWEALGCTFTGKVVVLWMKHWNAGGNILSLAFS